jgi:hypothetical protein
MLRSPRGVISLSRERDIPEKAYVSLSATREAQELEHTAHCPLCGTVETAIWRSPGMRIIRNREPDVLEGLTYIHPPMEPIQMIFPFLFSLMYGKNALEMFKPPKTLVLRSGHEYCSDTQLGNKNILELIQSFFRRSLFNCSNEDVSYNKVSNTRLTSEEQTHPHCSLKRRYDRR